jgi:hypothetical protein
MWNKQTKTIVGLAALAVAGYYIWDKTKKKDVVAPAAAAPAAPEATSASFTGEVGKRLRADGVMTRMGRRPVRLRPLPNVDEAAPVAAVPVRAGEKLNLQLGMPQGGAGEVFAGADGWKGSPLTSNIAGGFFNVKDSGF